MKNLQSLVTVHTHTHTHTRVSLIEDKNSKRLTLQKVMLFLI